MKCNIKNQRVTLTAAILALALGAQGQVISWNVDVWGTIGSGEHAGVVDAYNWNNTYALHGNATGASVGNLNLVDSTGATSTLDIYQLASQNWWNYWSMQGSGPALDADGSSNKRLLNGYNNKGSSEAPFLSRITLDQIPYAQYDLYVYFGTDAAGRVGTVTDGATTFDFSTLGVASIGGANATLTLTTDTTGANPGANYAVFSGLTGSTRTIDVSIPDWGGIAGVQIVAVPEPGAMTIGLLGFAALGARWRLRRR